MAAMNTSSENTSSTSVAADNSTTSATSPNHASRREFLKVAAAATAGVTAAMAVPHTAYAAGTDTLRVGLIGCGGRGTGAAGQALKADKGTVLTALGDAFPDRLQRSLDSLRKGAPEQVKVDTERCFTGLDAYKKVIDSGVDVVLLTQPPGFRPGHMQYALEAGKHVFAEKPMAVDAPGVRQVAQCVELARKKNLALVAGFNCRYTSGPRALMGKIHEGAIGDVVAMYTTFNTGYLWVFPRKPEWSDMEWQVRNWYYFTWLSGDHLVEQAVHNCDKLAWAMKDQPPARAMAVGGRQARTDPMYGHIFDHFAVVYEWANGTRGFLFCRQQQGCPGDVSDHIMGTKGTADMVGNRHAITGQNAWTFDGPDDSGHQIEHNELFASIRAGKPINDGQRMVNSTMISILGRMAAYTGQVITWEQAMNSQEKVGPEKVEWGPTPTPPVAVPGKTKFL
jgi:myo-inositol 2-dehydrogenase/D-chiro-inositol 1-dehydrogenase